MAFSFSPKIVTDGLVLYLDAANTRSYPGSGTAWTDISRGGNNGTLNNGPTFSNSNGGAIVCDGTDDSVTSTFAWNRNNFSFTWFMYPTNTTNWTPAISVNGWGDFVWHSTAEGSVYAGTDVNFRLTPNSPGCGAGVVPKNVWQSWTCTFVSTNNSTGTFKLYKNGVYINQATTTYPTTASSTQTLGIGYNLNIALLMAYNKTLSDNEILQTYNATKTRFGL